MHRRVMLAALLAAASPAAANDSTAELTTGGLILSRSDAVEMVSEDLFISPEKVTVDYVFRNHDTEKDVETIVAFPMPDIEGNPFTMPAIPDAQSDNFLGFEVTVEGETVAPQLDHRAIAVGIDITDDLKAQGVPLFPYGDEAIAALAKLPQDVADQWLDRGIMIIDEYDDGSGWKKVRTPFWGLRSTYWWRTTFPAGKEVKVAHHYRPSVGATAGLSFLTEGRLEGPIYEDYKRRYCFDPQFERAVLKAVKESPDGYPQLYETRLAYILRTGGNWATGNIGTFKLTVDKGDPEALVSFCGQNVRKTGPTTFEVTAKEFYPERDLHVLMLKEYEQARGPAVKPHRKRRR